MNSTNRALNRTLLLLVGLFLVAVGAAVILLFTLPAAVGVWQTGSSNALDWIEGAAQATRIPDTSANWLGIGCVAVLLLLIVLLIVFLAKLGGRRSRTVLASDATRTDLGQITLSESFVSDALRHSLDRRSDILTASVTANDVRRSPVLHVSVTPRQNTSPRRIVEDVDQLVTNLATLTGRPTATYISVRTGLRARLAPDQPRVQ